MGSHCELIFDHSVEGGDRDPGSCVLVVCVEEAIASTLSS